MATTIIDFSPQALEIDEVAEAAKTINPDIPPPTLPTISVTKAINNNRHYGDVFINSAPDVLFVAEYAAPGQDSAGALVVWENYYNASHYEVFKRVYTAQDNSWQRIFIIDSNNLATETAQYSPYIENVLKLQIDSGYYAILDTNVQTDQIVEYKVAAGNYPQSADIDYEIALKSQGKISPVTINATDTIFDFSNRVFSVPDYAWIIAMLNSGAQFFGKKPATTPLAQFIGISTAYIPTDLSLVPRMLQESIYYFGLKATFRNMFVYTNDTTDNVGGSNFFDFVIESMDESKNSLSYNTLQSKLRTAYPNYDDYITRLKNGTLKGQPIDVPNYYDDAHFNSLSDFTYMYLRLNTILVGVLYANDNDPAIRNPTRDIVLGGAGGILGTTTLRPLPISTTRAPIKTPTNPILGILGSLK